MDLNKYYQWEYMALSSIIWLMIKWFNFDSVEMETEYRKDVESGVWISLKIVQGNVANYITGQRPDIVKKRLIEYLDSKNIRETYLKEKG